jgi:hypothetical protein
MPYFICWSGWRSVHQQFLVAALGSSGSPNATTQPACEVSQTIFQTGVRSAFKPVNPVENLKSAASADTPAPGDSDFERCAYRPRLQNWRPAWADVRHREPGRGNGRDDYCGCRFKALLQAPNVPNIGDLGSEVREKIRREHSKYGVPKGEPRRLADSCPVGCPEAQVKCGQGMIACRRTWNIPNLIGTLMPSEFKMAYPCPSWSR